MNDAVPASYCEFLDQVIDRAAIGARRDYAEGTSKRSGSLAGLESCRGLLPYELGRSLAAAQDVTTKLRMRSDQFSPPRYWEARCYDAEVEWVCNCVSVLLDMLHMPTIVRPTARAYLRVASIMGHDATRIASWPELHATGEVIRA